MPLVKPIFAGNWKMNMSPVQATEYLTEFCETYIESAVSSVILFPPAISFTAAYDAVPRDCDIQLGVQNVHWEAEGAYTGEISVAMARVAGAAFALVGHSERRHVFGETIAETVRKTRAAIDGGLSPVLCLGETLEERRAGRAKEVVDEQLAPVVGEMGAAETDRLLVAYEPVWAIGTGETASPADAADMHAYIRERLGRRFPTSAADAIPLLYGGSVKPDNARELLSQPNVDGVLVGGASLDPNSFGQICQNSA